MSAVLPQIGAARRSEYFIRLWGVALAGHVIGNWSQPDLPHLLGWINLGVGIVGAVLVVRPNSRLLLIGSGLVAASLVIEMPFTGNHWLVAGLVSVAILVSGGREKWFIPAARWILLIFYIFAALAKLNTGFLNTDVSCAVYYANQYLDGLGLASLGQSSPFSTSVIAVTVVTELSVPVLLMIKRTRYWGVVLASGFHIIISYDLLQHFYDFTSVLLPLFFLFLPDQSIALIAERSRRWLKTQGRTLLTLFWVIVATALVAMAAGPLLTITLPLLKILPFGLWVPFSLMWLMMLLGARARGERLEYRLQPSTGLIAVLVVANGLTPYFEVKTAYSFNMYSNLVTAEGATNHLLLDVTYPIRDGYRDPVEIIESSDSGLEIYRTAGYLIAYPQLRRYLADRRDVSLTYRRGGEIVALDRAADSPELVDPGPWWWRFLALRALDQQSPPRCQDVFLPAL